MVFRLQILYVKVFTTQMNIFSVGVIDVGNDLSALEAPAPSPASSAATTSFPKPHFSIPSETIYDSSSSSFSWSSSSSSSSAMANPTLRPPIFRASALIAGKLVALLIGLEVKVGKGGGGGGRLSFRALGSVEFSSSWVCWRISSSWVCWVFEFWAERGSEIGGERESREFFVFKNLI
ncbi:unnamed protein product [Prunus armeniaca]|uniref:Uncharacterized protein n=1 Tax=Prunus armeniaca TaxID=36596 RepID=A0A6J5XFS5_PRUAR|nr:unnamed protein product [Prunus armeniaca]